MIVTECEIPRALPISVLQGPDAIQRPLLMSIGLLRLAHNQYRRTPKAAEIAPLRHWQTQCQHKEHQMPEQQAITTNNQHAAINEGHLPSLFSCWLIYSTRSLVRDVSGTHASGSV